MLLHPEIYTRDCNECRKYMYDAKGEIKMLGRGTIKMKRPKQIPPPCEKGNCPKGHYTEQKTLSNMNYQTWLHFRRCKAVGKFPDDSVVAENARVISEVEAYCEHAATEKVIRTFTGGK